MGKAAVLTLFALLLVLLGVGGGAVRADEPGAAEDPVALEMLRVLQLRIEARIKAGEALARAGRLEEALETFRSVEQLAREGLQAIATRRAAPPARPTPVRPRVPVRQAKPPEAGPPPEEIEDPEDAKAGWLAIGGTKSAFRHRGGARPGWPKWAMDGVDDALRWLHAHQSPNGGWEAAGFNRWRDGKPVADLSSMPDGIGKPIHDPGVTGLALCAFLGAGYTNRGKHPYAATVARGLRYLKNLQDRDGCFGPRSTQTWIYGHLIATLAMVEAYGMTGSPIFRSSAQRGLDFTFLARNPYFGWRYGIKPGDNDTSVTGWAALVLHSAERIDAAAEAAGRPAPLRVDPAARAGIANWLRKVTDPETGGVGYQRRGSGPARTTEAMGRFPSERSEAMTASGLVMRIFGGEDPHTSELVRKGVALCQRLLPEWNPDNGRIDHYYWHFGSLAMYQVGGQAWEAWEDALRKAVAQTQRKDTDFGRYKGSWDPIGPWGPEGGRVYSTAMLAMSLAVHARYAREFPVGD